MANCTEMYRNFFAIARGRLIAKPLPKTKGLSLILKEKNPGGDFSIGSYFSCFIHFFDNIEPIIEKILFCANFSTTLVMDNFYE